MKQFDRNIRLFGEETQLKLMSKRTLLVGVGGVGGYVAECLARSGIANITIIDGDIVDITNINRQILALHSNIGQTKVSVMKNRMLDINPNANITAIYDRVTEQNASAITSESWDYIIDCIDNVNDKVALIVNSIQNGKTIISSMGAGNRLKINPQIMDIYDTKYDGLAKALRSKLRKCGVKSLTVACDTSVSLANTGETGSISYAPALMGLTIAQKVIGDLIN